MKNLIEQLLEDFSTREVFLFRIACGACGQEFANKPARFSKAGMTPATQGKQLIYDTVYAQERAAVRQRAAREAAEHLNYCPICRRLICNRCFLICDDLDMCVSCAARLEETGTPVLTHLAEVDAVI